jgi:hypothetical protein
MPLPASTRSQLINKFLIKLSVRSSTELVHRQSRYHRFSTITARLYSILRGFNYRNNFPVPTLLFPFIPSSWQVSTSVTEPHPIWRWRNHCAACTLTHPTANIPPAELLTSPHGHHHAPSYHSGSILPFMWCDKSRLCVLREEEVWQEKIYKREK